MCKLLMKLTSLAVFNFSTHSLSSKMYYIVVTLSYYTEFGCSEIVFHFKGNCEDITIGADNPKTAAILGFTLPLTTFEGGLFCCAWLSIHVFKCMPGTSIVGLNKVLTKFTFCANLFHNT